MEAIINFLIWDNMTSISKEDIYCITCEGCHTIYEQTGDMLRNRVTVHRQGIRHPDMGAIWKYAEK